VHQGSRSEYKGSNILRVLSWGWYNVSGEKIVHPKP
jgi:hypothetical protein